MLGLLAIDALDCLAATSTAYIALKGQRSLQVTGALDWPRHDDVSASSLSSGKIQGDSESDSLSVKTFPSPNGSDSTLDTLDGSAMSQEHEWKTSPALDGFGILLLISISIFVLAYAMHGIVVVARRRWSMKGEWGRLKTYQVVLAENEAFKNLNQDEPLDVELVEGSSTGCSCEEAELC